MAGRIKTQIIDSSNGAGLSLQLLPREIDGVDTFHFRIAQGQAIAAKSPAGTATVLFFLAGAGLITCRGASFHFDGMSVFIPPPDCAYEISALSEADCLEIRWALRDGESAAFAAGSLPYFSAYSDCKTYSESFKSAKTINRTVVPKGLVPRFCMGSVQTGGPDAVGAHKHPMLEQHFFGLQGNDVIVSADEEQAAFTENMLLHIPLGSEHSVRVEQGKKLHYLWLDFFAEQEGLSWITTMHKENK